VRDPGHDAPQQPLGAGESSSPKRSELVRRTGRAPIVKMSRMIPPTPVAAPSKGSTALGWLCDSILKAIAQPSPTSMMPGVLLAGLHEHPPEPAVAPLFSVGKPFSSGRCSCRSSAPTT
jgi:hypothetical protein